MVVTVQGMVPFSLLCSMSVWCERTKVRCCVRNKGVNKISQNTKFWLITYHFNDEEICFADKGPNFSACLKGFLKDA